MVDWSMLIGDVLCQIALKLDDAEDLIYFSAVCRSWHHVYTMVKNNWTSKMPWLMLAENTENNPNHLRKIYCPSKKKCYQLKLPQTFGARCWGTSSGWIVTSDLKLELHLFNPLTGVRILLPTPPKYISEEEVLNPIEYNSDDDNIYTIEWERTNLVHNIIVFGGDKCNSDYLVVAIYDYTVGRVAYIRSNDESWTLVTTLFIPNDFRCRAYDIVCRGTQIIILYGTGGLGYFELSENQPVTAMEYAPRPLELLDRLHKTIHGMYLLDAFGDILMVLRYKNRYNAQEVGYETIDIEVHKLNFDTKKWEKTIDLGDVALFVGNHCSMAVRASSSRNCKPNAIYFTDDEFEFWDSPKLCGGNDMGIFELQKQEFDKFYQGDDMNSEFCPPLWFMPKF